MTRRSKFYGVIIVLAILAIIFTVAYLQYQADKRKQAKPKPVAFTQAVVEPSPKAVVTEQVSKAPDQQRKARKSAQIASNAQVTTAEASPTPEAEINFQRQSRGLRRVFFYPQSVRGFAVPKGKIALEEPIGTEPINQCRPNLYLDCVVAQGDVQLRIMECLKTIECETCLSREKKVNDLSCDELKQKVIQ